MLVAALLYALLAVIMVGQGLLPGRTLTGSDYLWSTTPWAASRPAEVPPLGSNFETIDAAEVFLPFYQHTRARLPDVPLWNPHIMGGRPFVANMQSSVFSPFTVPSYVLPFWRSLGFVAVLKLFLAGFGTFLLARALGMRYAGAFLAGTVFAFGTFFVVWLAWPLTSHFALIPFLLLLTEMLLRRPGLLPASGLAAVVGIELVSGHPESAFQALFVTVLWFAFRLLAVHRRRLGKGIRPLLRPTLLFAGALLLGAAIASVAIGPFLELLLHSGDISRRAQTGPDHWPAKYLGALFLHDYWGRPTNGTTIEPFMSVRGWYAGGVTLILAVAAIVLRPTRDRVAVAAFGAFCAAVVVGVPPFFQILTSLPVFSSAHNQRLLIFVLLALGLLAGWGLDDLASKRVVARWRARTTALAGLTILVVPVAWMVAAGTLDLGKAWPGLKVAWAFVTPPVVDSTDPAGPAASTIRMSALAQWLPLAGIGLGLIVLRLSPRRRLPATAFVVLVVGVLAVDLFRANMGYNPAIPVDTASQPATPAIQYLQSRAPSRFVGVGVNPAYQPLPADLAMRYGLYDARGYDFPVEKRFDRLWRRNVAPGIEAITQPVEFATATPAALRALSLLSVSDLIREPDAPIRPGLRLTYRGSDASVFANDRALPKVFLAGSQHRVRGDDEALAAATAPAFDGRRTVVTEQHVPGLPEGAGVARSPGHARLVRYGDDTVVARARARRRSMLVLTDVHFPGWTATVDGKDVPIHRVDYLLRGVSLPPGSHTIEFRYHPASWRASWIVTVLGLLGLVLTTSLGLLSRRRGRTAQGTPA